MNQNKHEQWLTTVVEQKSKVDKVQSRELLKQAQPGNTRQDLSRSILEDLSSQGYTTVTWNAENSRHSVCLELNNQKWLIEDFLSGLSHDAPIFERSHPGDTNCFIVVEGPELPTVRVDPYGNEEEI